MISIVITTAAAMAATTRAAIATPEIPCRSLTIESTRLSTTGPLSNWDGLNYYSLFCIFTQCSTPLLQVPALLLNNSKINPAPMFPGGPTPYELDSPAPSDQETTLS